MYFTGAQSFSQLAWRYLITGVLNLLRPEADGQCAGHAGLLLFTWRCCTSIIISMGAWGILYTVILKFPCSFSCLTVFVEAGCHSGKSLEPWTPLSPDCSQYTHSWEGKCHFFHISSRNWAQTEIKKLKITFPFDNRYDLETIFARNRLRINNACFPLQLKAELSINTDKDSQHCQKCHTRLLSCCPPPRLRLSCCCCGDMLSIQPPDDLQLTVRLSSGDEEVTDIPLITSDSGRQKPSQHKRR